MSIEDQPVSNVAWIERERIYANSYNPNRVAPPELKLLKVSILADGWTQPIVVRPSGVSPSSADDEYSYEVVDGYHRWLIAGDASIAALTNGMLPVVIIAPKLEDQMMSTIRHNRARGTHAVLPMAEIVRTLIDERGLSPEDVSELLSMEDEEVERLYDRSGMTVRGADRNGELGKGWVPKV